MDVMSRPDRATFRLPAAALFFPVLLLLCVIPLATVGGAWGVMFVVPVLALSWVIVTRTTASPSTVTAHGLLGAHRMAWTEMDGLELKDSRWAVAVATDGRRLRLPMVRPRDLPRLAAVSGGSLRLEAPIGPGDDEAAAAQDVPGLAEPASDDPAAFDQQGRPDPAAVTGPPAPSVEPSG